MRIAIVHNEVKEDGRIDEMDVLIQADAVFKSLKELGHDVYQLPCGLDLSHIRGMLDDLAPDMVFNLVESLGGEERFIHLFPALLDAMGLQYTGSHTEAIFLTTHKVLAKDRMSMANLPTPPWIGPYPYDVPPMHHNKTTLPYPESQWIIKSLRDHGSLGLDDSNIVSGKTEEELKAILRERAMDLGGACFAEQYIHGREFNVSLLGGHDGPDILPAEIIFEGFEEGKPAIVGYNAKWIEGTCEYSGTPRSFDFKDSDHQLLSVLKSLALRCWNVFGLKGYARVDFRVDELGQPWILEINCNPCLNPDGGFPAAIMESGLTYTSLIERIINESGKPVVPVTDRRSPGDIRLRYEAIPSDALAVRRLTDATGFFYPYEVDVAEELVLERLNKGDVCGYFFVFAEENGSLVGYTCYGPIACTATSFDFYWIAVSPGMQGRGLGKLLVQETERLIKEAKGKRVYVETSQRPLYDSTRAFYERCGYFAEAIQKDFYGPGDGKVTYCRVIE